MPAEAAIAMEGRDLEEVRKRGRLLYDDRAPDESAHTWFEVDHGRGAVVVVRPDLWVGVSVFLNRGDLLDSYFGKWLVPDSRGHGG